jgi:hypothetical protein
MSEAGGTVPGMRGDRADYDWLPGRKTTRLWRSGDPGSWAVREVQLGTYGLTGWFVYRTGKRWTGCWTFHFERDACEWVEQCLGQATGWAEIEATEDEPV